MKAYDLQMFADKEAVSGKKIVYLFRPLSKAATQAGAVLAFTTENGRTKSKDADSTTTKDGDVRTPGASETEITATALVAKGDTLVESLEDAMDADGLIEVWEANLAEPASGEDGKFKGRYYQGYLTEIELTSNAEDHAEYSLTFGINGSGKSGSVSVTSEQQEAAAYAFKDTTAGS